MCGLTFFVVYVWFEEGGFFVHLRITPVAPLSAMTMDMMKKLSATIPRDSLHVRPTAMMPAANCHVAAL